VVALRNLASQVQACLGSRGLLVIVVVVFLELLELCYVVNDVVRADRSVFIRCRLNFFVSFKGIFVPFIVNFRFWVTASG